MMPWLNLREKRRWNKTEIKLANSVRGSRRGTITSADSRRSFECHVGFPLGVVIQAETCDKTSTSNNTELLPLRMTLRCNIRCQFCVAVQLIIVNPIFTFINVNRTSHVMPEESRSVEQKKWLYSYWYKQTSASGRRKKKQKKVRRALRNYA